MSVFVIKTKEFIDFSKGWKVIAETSVIAVNTYEALEIVSNQYKSNQYIHKAISEKETIGESVRWRYF